MPFARQNMTEMYEGGPFDQGCADGATDATTGFASVKRITFAGVVGEIVTLQAWLVEATLIQFCVVTVGRNFFQTHLTHH